MSFRASIQLARGATHGSNGGPGQASAASPLHGDTIHVTRVSRSFVPTRVSPACCFATLLSGRMGCSSRPGSGQAPDLHAPARFSISCDARASPPISQNWFITLHNLSGQSRTKRTGKNQGEKQTLSHDETVNRKRIQVFGEAAGFLIDIVPPSMMDPNTDDGDDGNHEPHDGRRIISGSSARRAITIFGAGQTTARHRSPSGQSVTSEDNALVCTTRDVSCARIRKASVFPGAALMMNDSSHRRGSLNSEKSFCLGDGFPFH